MSTTSASLRGQLVGRVMAHGLRLAKGRRDLHDGSTLEDLAAEVARMRPRLEAIASRVRVPADTIVEDVVGAPVPTEWVRPHGRERHDGPVILHLHGGAYALGSPKTHRGMTNALASVSRGTSFVPDYRLAPEHPFPSAVDDALAAYRWLVDAADVAPGRVAVSGDSAGGGLALALLLRLRDEGLPLPACYVGLSPWTDLTGSAPSIVDNADRDVLFGAVPTALAGRVGELYHGDTAHPMVSPLFADLSGLPPMLVHVGGHELIRDDGLRLVDRARDHGVDASAGVFAGMWHVFQAFPIPETRRSMREIGGFVRRHTS